MSDCSDDENLIINFNNSIDLPQDPSDCEGTDMTSLDEKFNCVKKWVKEILEPEVINNANIFDPDETGMIENIANIMTPEAILDPATIINTLPFSCMVKLIQHFSDCNQGIPEDKVKAAFTAFNEVTGWNPLNMNVFVTEINRSTTEILNYTSYYMFFPIMIILLIAIWLMVGFKWINWVTALFMSVFVIVVLYAFSVIYRIHVHQLLTNNNATLQKSTSAAQESYQNSIAYWPQGLFAAACAVTCNGETGCWICNNPTNCGPCPACNIAEDEMDLRQQRRNLANINKSKKYRKY